MKNSFIRRFQRRLVNSSKIEDYLLLSFIPFIAVILANIINIWEPINGENSTGYKYALNHMSLIVILPLSLYLLRKLGDYLFGINLRIYHQNKVPLLSIFQDNHVQTEVHKKLKKFALSPRISYVVIFLDISFHIFDIGEILKQYFLAFINPKISYDILETYHHNIYWGNLFLLREDINIEINFLFTFLVYLCQFIVVLIAFTAITLVLLHNIVYLRLIYQRSRVRENQIQYYIVLNFDDPNRHFGLKKVNFIFNLQIAFLFVAGLFTLASRLHSTKQIPFSQLIYNFKNFNWNNLFIEEELSKIFDYLFTARGQYVILISWLFAFFVVLLPTFVKFLPFFSRNVAFYGWSIDNYLREFIPPTDDNKYPMRNSREVDLVASKFASNSFWPSGDDIARGLFIFVFWICLNILFPINCIISLSIFLAIAWILAESLLNCFRWILGHIDQRLVKRRVDVTPGDTIVGNQINQSGNFGIGYHEGSIESGAKVAGMINEAQQQKLVAAAAEIQQLLEQLSQTYPTNTEAQQMIVAKEAIKRIESNPHWKQRVINAAKEGGLASLEKALDNPLGAFITEAIKGWLEA
ncbi:MAG: hypothetical protein AB4060_03075 [Crocosphaera sp.]